MAAIATTRQWCFTVDDELCKNPQLTPAIIQEIRDWVETQPHLPPVEDEKIILFIHACQYNLDFTRKTIESHYSCRTSYTEFFSNRDPMDKQLQDIAPIVGYAVLPERDTDGNQVFWTRLIVTDASLYHFASAVKLMIMTMDAVQLESGTAPGLITVMDAAGYSLSHALRCQLGSAKKLLTYTQEGATCFPKVIHIINASTVIDKILSLLKPFLKSDLLSRIVMHRTSNGNYESLYKHLPKAILPVDYGGNAICFKELNMANMKTLERHREWFTEEEKCRTALAKREKKGDKATANISTSFRKLELD